MTEQHFYDENGTKAIDAVLVSSKDESSLNLSFKERYEEVRR
jgi:hypothetical protein